MNMNKELLEKIIASVEKEHRVHLYDLAEAVVKECIQVCQSRVGNSDYNTGRMHCVSDIKEHFGSNKAKGLLGIPTSQFSRNLKSDVV